MNGNACMKVNSAAFVDYNSHIGYPFSEDNLVECRWEGYLEERESVSRREDPIHIGSSSTSEHPPIGPIAPEPGDLSTPFRPNAAWIGDHSSEIQTLWDPVKQNDSGRQIRGRRQEAAEYDGAARCGRQEKVHRMWTDLEYRREDEATLSDKLNTEKEEEDFASINNKERIPPEGWSSSIDIIRKPLPSNIPLPINVPLPEPHGMHSHPASEVSQTLIQLNPEYLCRLLRCIAEGNEQAIEQAVQFVYTIPLLEHMFDDFFPVPHLVRALILSDHQVASVIASQNIARISHPDLFPLFSNGVLRACLYALVEIDQECTLREFKRAGGDTATLMKRWEKPVLCANSIKGIEAYLTQLRPAAFNCYHTLKREIVCFFWEACAANGIQRKILNGHANPDSSCRKEKMHGSALHDLVLFLHREMLLYGTIPCLRDAVLGDCNHPKGLPCKWRHIGHRCFGQRLFHKGEKKASPVPHSGTPHTAPQQQQPQPHQHVSPGTPHGHHSHAPHHHNTHVPVGGRSGHYGPRGASHAHGAQTRSFGSAHAHAQGPSSYGAAGRVSHGWHPPPWTGQAPRQHQRAY